MTRSLNKVTLIGNLTRDPELKYTPSGAAVCTFGLATNRQWEKDGQKQEEVEFHRLVAWNRLAEICAQWLKKGMQVYVEGRLQTRKWTGQDEIERSITEVVLSEMLMLGNRGSTDGGSADDQSPNQTSETVVPVDNFDPDEVDAKAEESSKKSKKSENSDDDIPF